MTGPTRVAEAAGRQRPRLAILIAWAAAVVTWLAWSHRTGTGPVEAADSLRNVLADRRWGPVLYVALYVLRPLILFPASALTVLGGVVLGPVAGVAYTIIGANLSSAASYGGAIVYAQQTLRGLPPLVGPTAQLATASIILIPISLLVERPYLLPMPSWPAASSLLLLAVLSTARVWSMSAS